MEVYFSWHETPRDEVLNKDFGCCKSFLLLKNKTIALYTQASQLQLNWEFKNSFAITMWI
jgi:hypothetical protein